MIRSIPMLLCGALALAAGSDENLPVLVEQALDQPTELTIENLPISEALAIIADKTGVGLRLGPEALGYLPYGEKTKVSVRLENVRLREGIQAICNQLAMNYQVAGSGVELLPAEALRRLGRRASWEELSLVSQLMQKSWKGSGGAYEELGAIVQFKLPPGGPALDWAALSAQLRAAGAGRADEVLTTACTALGCTWYPWSENIVVLPVFDQTVRQLQRTVSLNYAHADLGDVLRGLSRQLDVNIAIDPAAAARIPARTRQSFTLLAEGATGDEALQQIGVAIGLAFQVQPGAVVFYSPEQSAQAQPAAAAADAAAPRRDSIVGKIIIPGGEGAYQIEFFIRESDLTDEEKALREKAVDKAREAMRRELSQQLGTP